MFRLHESWIGKTRFVRIHRSGCPRCLDGTATPPDSGEADPLWIPRSDYAPIESYEQALAVATERGAQVVENCDVCRPKPR